MSLSSWCTLWKPSTPYCSQKIGCLPFEWNLQGLCSALHHGQMPLATCGKCYGSIASYHSSDCTSRYRSIIWKQWHDTLSLLGPAKGYDKTFWKKTEKVRRKESRHSIRLLAKCSKPSTQGFCRTIYRPPYWLSPPEFFKHGRLGGPW